MKNKNIKLLNFKVDARSAVPVYQQVKEAIRHFIISGHLQNGDQLMSIRDLAARILIHPNTIVKVYYQLEMEGLIEAKAGKGYFVTTGQTNLKKEKRETFQRLIAEFLAKAAQLGYPFTEIYQEMTRIKNKTKSIPEDTNDKD